MGSPTRVTLATLLALMLFAGDSQADFTFVQLSDTHIGESSYLEPILRSVVGEINALSPRPSFVVITGDIAQGTTALYNTWKSIMSGLDQSIPYYAVPGNHDATNSTWTDATGPLYQAITVDNCRFVFMNSQGTSRAGGWGEFDATQWTWIQNEFANSGSFGQLFLACHHPLRIGWMDRTQQDELYRLLALHEATAWMAGHWHGGSLEMIDSTAHIIGEAPHYDAFRVYEVRADSVIVRKKVIGGGFDPSGEYRLRNPRFEASTSSVPLVVQQPVGIGRGQAGTVHDLLGRQHPGEMSKRIPPARIRPGCSAGLVIYRTSDARPGCFITTTR